MSKKVHLLHKAIADKIESVLPPDSLIRDKACGGDQRIPLFYVAKKSREAEYCNVDLLILKGHKIKVIVEIEESNVKPTQICGKFLTSALANYFIHYCERNEPIEMNDSVAFIQIVDTSRLVKDKTAKFRQWKALEDSINKILPLKNSKITSYTLVTTDELDRLAPFIKKCMARYVVFEDLEGAVGPKVHHVDCFYYRRWLSNPTSTTTWHGPYESKEEAWKICERLSSRSDFQPSKHRCVG